MTELAGKSISTASNMQRLYFFVGTLGRGSSLASYGLCWCRAFLKLQNRRLFADSVGSVPKMRPNPDPRP